MNSGGRSLRFSVLHSRTTPANSWSCSVKTAAKARYRPWTIRLPFAGPARRICCYAIFAF